MKFSILTFNNKVGILSHALLLKKIINNITDSVEIIFLDEIKSDYKSDIGIWIQNCCYQLLENFKTNIFYFIEEWFDQDIEYLKKFDYVICTSKYSYDLIKDCCNAIYLPFVSKNYFNETIQKDKEYLHFMGRSIQKNTELVLGQNINITLIDPYNRYRPNSNFNHVNSYQTNYQLEHLLNSHNTHICCSIYESWGHYLFEGLSTGAEIICSDIPVFREQLDPDLVHFIPTKEKHDMSYMYCADNVNNLYRYRKAFFVDENYFGEYIKNFKLIGKNLERIKLFNAIINNNTKNIIQFFKNI